MEKNGWLIGLLAILLCVNLVGFYLIGINQVNEQDIANKITTQVLANIPAQAAVPTAAEIASLIKVPEAPTIPEFKSDSKVSDLWDNLYADEIEELENQTYNVSVNELEKRNYRSLENYLKDNIENFDELEDVDIKDYDITITELGLDEDEDKIAIVDLELKVRYSLLEGADEDLKKTIHAIATVTFDEGDYSDEDIEIIFQ